MEQKGKPETDSHMIIYDKSDKGIYLEKKGLFIT